MKRLCSLLLLFTLSCLPAGGVTVSDVLKMSGDDLNSRLHCSVTGVVTSVFQWQSNSCVIADPEDTDGPGIYVGGQMPRFPRAKVVGGRKLAVGDLVAIDGCATEMLLEPGMAAFVIEVIGHRELPSPRLRHVAELMHGRCNNRRVSVEGVFWGTRVMKPADGDITMIRIGTEDGPLVVRTPGRHPELEKLRNRKVRIEGLCIPMFNARQELISAEVEMPSPDGIVTLEGAPEQNGVDVVRGPVVYCDREAGFCVVFDERRDHSTRVVAQDAAELPSVGEYVEAEGFRLVAESVGYLEHGRFSVLPYRVPCEPTELTGEEIWRLLTHFSLSELDYSYRFVRIRGRVSSFDRHDDGKLIIDCETGEGNMTAEVFVPAGYEKRLVDRPMVRLTGILKVHLIRSGQDGRTLAADAVTLQLRDTGDIEIVPDDEARGRRFRRLVRTGALYLSGPVFLALVIVLLVAWRRRSTAAADAVLAEVARRGPRGRARRDRPGRRRPGDGPARYP